MEANILRVLIVEDTPERQKILKSLYKDHAWILAHTAERAICLLNVYDFDLITLDFDLAGKRRGDTVASFITLSRNAKTKVIVHSMNPIGVERIKKILPNADCVPLSKITKSNQTFIKFRQELKRGVDINLAFVFRQVESKAKINKT